MLLALNREEKPIIVVKMQLYKIHNLHALYCIISKSLFDFSFLCVTIAACSIFAEYFVEVIIVKSREVDCNSWKGILI